MTLKAPYILALCTASRDPQSSMAFGLCARLGFMTTQFEVEAARVIHSVVHFSPARETVAIEFLYEFNRVPQLGDLVTAVLSGEASTDTDEWVQGVQRALGVLGHDELAEALKPVRDLASDYLTHLLIAVRDPGGRKTPQVSTSNSPESLASLNEISALVNQAVIKRNQAALKKLVFARDGYNCPLTDSSFDPTDSLAITPECAHIIPFSLHDKTLSLRMIRSFSGHEFTTQEIIANINHPRNAFHLQKDVHDYFGNLVWGIEAEYVSEQHVKYVYRQVTPGTLRFVSRQDGDELTFNGGEQGDKIDGPNPSFCNLRLAITRAFHACGAADMITKIYANYDNDDFVLQPTYFGGPFVPDEHLFLRLGSRLASHV